MTDILQFLLDMRSGAVASDCNQKFNEVVKAVVDTGGKGELNIKLSIAPSKFGTGGCADSRLDRSLDEITRSRSLTWRLHCYSCRSERRSAFAAAWKGRTLYDPRQGGL